MVSCPLSRRTGCAILLVTLLSSVYVFLPLKNTTSSSNQRPYFQVQLAAKFLSLIHRKVHVVPSSSYQECERHVAQHLCRTSVMQSLLSHCTFCCHEHKMFLLPQVTQHGCLFCSSWMRFIISFNPSTSGFSIGTAGRMYLVRIGSCPSSAYFS